MTDRDALYHAILANPDDDTLRLVYADALEESGDPRRAAFVRTHVELARVPDDDPLAIQARYHDPKEDAARRRAELPPLPDKLSWPHDPFRRGLPGAVQARDGGAFVGHAEHLFARYPIEALELTVVRLAEAADLAACPYLNRLRSLSFVQGVSRQGIAPLLESEHVARLTELHLGPQFTTAEAIGEVARSQLFPRLTSLSLRADRAGGAVTAALAGLTRPPRLKRLDISGNRLTWLSLDTLRTSAVLDSLGELDLSDNNLGPEGLAALEEVPLPNLRALHLARTRPAVEGVAVLTAAGFFRELRALSLAGNILGPEAALDLAGAPGNLLALDLSDNRVGDTGALALAQSGHLSELLYLNLTGNAIDAPAANRLRKRFGDRVVL